MGLFIFNIKPTVTLSSYKRTVTYGVEEPLTCEVSKFYPESLTIKWYKTSSASGNRTALDKAYNSETIRNLDGTYSANSVIFIKPSSMEEDGDVYSCTVRDTTFNIDQDVHLKLSVEPPKLSKITTEEDMIHMYRLRLSCKMSYFKPKTLRISLYVKREGDSERQLITFCKYQPSSDEEELEDFPSRSNTMDAGLKILNQEKLLLWHSCQCNIYVTPDLKRDNGAELTLEVEHPSLHSPILESYNLEIREDYLRLSPIEVSQQPRHGENITLTCHINTFKWKDLNVTWKKDNLLLKNSAEVISIDREVYDHSYVHDLEEKREGGTYITSSSLKFRVKARTDNGSQYICEVHHAGGRKMMTYTLNTDVTGLSGRSSNSDDGFSSTSQTDELEEDGTPSELSSISDEMRNLVK
ncbi:uncharacterized protein [Hyperolius riggenbachi]|uniref:uncharacterized protein n=1 Tax=Hyperolius riggenbachi TaxID=752182 RepID=UPI0035A39F4B